MAADDRSPSNPLDAARRLAGPVRQKRFYAHAAMVPEDAGYALRLDGKRAMTPGRRPLVTPHADLAQAIAAEWEAQQEFIDPAAMPATRLANTAIDGVTDRMAEVRAGVIAYAGADLLCYRAGEPEGLAAEQRRQWDPILAWAEHRFGVRFVLAEGVMHVPQPEPTISALSAELARVDDPFRLAGLHVAATLTASAILALALAEAAIGPDQAWDAAHVDEDWNIGRWGTDAEAAERRRRRRADFTAAALAMASP